MTLNLKIHLRTSARILIHVDICARIRRLQGDLEPDLNLYAWDAALRTSAAPTYFPVHRYVPVCVSYFVLVVDH